MKYLNTIKHLKLAYFELFTFNYCEDRAYEIFEISSCKLDSCFVKVSF